MAKTGSYSFRTLVKMGLWGFCKVTTLARLGKSTSKEGSVNLERTIRLYETFALALVPGGLGLTPVVGGGGGGQHGTAWR